MLSSFPMLGPFFEGKALTEGDAVYNLRGEKGGFDYSKYA